MANGYCPALLEHINSIANCSSPGRKLTPAGFTKMLLNFQNSLASPVNNGYDSATGHERTLTVWYRKRPLASDVKDEEDCEVDIIPARLEWQLPNLLYREFSFFLNDTEIQKYCSDASNTVSAGRPATPFMQEHFDYFVSAANAILKSINQALLTEMSTKFGDNVTIGGSDGKIININSGGANWTLDDGIISLLSDLRENEICENISIVGGGLYSAFDIAQMAACCNAAGFDASRFGMPKFYFDKDSQPIWGTNAIGVFAQDSAKFLSKLRFVRAFSGQHGGSYFFTMPLPVNEYCCLDDNMSDLIFDIQMRYIDCPSTIDVNGTPTSVGRGWQIIVSKTFGLWVTPTDAYNAGDDLEGTNGTLKYFVTNEATSPGAYPYTY